MTAEENFGAALRVIDDVWSTLSRHGLYGGDTGPLERLPDIGLPAITERATLGREILARLEAIDVDSLPHDLPYTVEMARQTAERWSREDEWYWLLFDPMGVGFYAMFAPTAYSCGFLLNSLVPSLRGFPFRTPGDGYRYVGLVHDYGRLIGQMLERTQGQAERGIYMPRPQLEQAIAMVENLRAGVAALLMPDASRLAAIDAEEVIAQVAAATADAVLPAFDALADFLKHPDYAAPAPETVGLSQYPGGAEAYAEMVRLHTTLDLTPEQVHQIGIDRIADIRAQMRKLLDEIGFEGSPLDYLAHSGSDPKWRASGAEEIGAFFQRYIDRIAPHIDANFNFKPKAAHGVQPLPEALSGSMTFGYYTPPTQTDDRGLFVFQRGQPVAGAAQQYRRAQLS